MRYVFLLLSLLTSVFAYAAFTINGAGTIITQSGIDPDLSGLVGIPGVTTEVTQEGTEVFTVYNLGNLNLNVTGTLTIDPERETLLMAATTGQPYLDVLSGGNLILGQEIVKNGYSRYSEGLAIFFTDDTTNTCCDEARSYLAVRSGGRLDWYGGEITSYGHNLTFSAGSIIRIYSDKAILRWRSENPQNQVRQWTTDLEVDAFTMIGGDLTFIGVPTRFDNYAPVHAEGAIAFSGNTPNVDYPLRNYAGGGRGNTKDVKMWSGSRPVLTNAASGTELNVGSHIVGNNTSFGILRVFQELNITVREFNAGPIQNAKTYFQDYDNGNRRLYNMEAPNIDLTGTLIYTGLSNASGVVPTLSVLTGSVVADTSFGGPGDAVNTAMYAWDYRSKNNNTEDLFDIGTISYLHTISFFADTPLKGVDGTNLTATLFEDRSITETNKATVDAYTTIDDSYQFYDRAKSFLYDNYTGQDQTIVLRADETIDARTFNVVVDAAAAQTFDFDGATITIRSSSFRGDFIATTGTVTSVNGAIIDGGIIDTAFDSFIRFENVTSWTAFANEADALADASSIDAGVGGEVFSYNFSAGTTYYFRIVNDNGYVFIYKKEPLQAGKTLLPFSEILNVIAKNANELNVLLENQDVINNNTQLASCIVPADIITNTTNISSAIGTLALGNPTGTDSSLSFVGIEDWYIYNSQNDAINGTNVLASDLQAVNYNFNYSADMVFFIAAYTTDGARIIKKFIPTAAGNTSLDFNTQAILSDLDAIILKLRNNQNIMNGNTIDSSILVPAMDDVDK